MCLHEKPFELETSEDITKVFRNEEMEDEEMEFMDGTWKKEINTWEELVGNNLLNQEAVIEGAVHSIRNMGDVAFIILNPLPNSQPIFLSSIRIVQLQPCQNQAA